MLVLHSKKVILHYRKKKKISLVIVSLYLEANANSFGQSPFWEDCLHLWYNSAAQHPSLRSDKVAVLFDPGYHCKVLREISGDDAADTFLLKLLWSVKYWGQKRRWSEDKNFVETIQQTSKCIQAFHSLTVTYRSILSRNQRGKGNIPQYFKFS